PELLLTRPQDGVARGERLCVTWNEADPAPLSAPPLQNRLIGGIRLFAAILITAVLGVFFVLGATLRKTLGHVVSYHFWIARLWARICVALLGMRQEVRGAPIAEGALVANHCSWSDIVVLRSVRLVYFVSKSDVAKWVGVGFLAKIAGTVFIERKRVEAKRQEAVLRDRIAAGQLLCFFPEGTSTDGMRVLPFKSSLFSAFFSDVPSDKIWIQPVSVRYLTAEGSGLPENFFGWWGSMPFGGHIRAVMSRSFGSRVIVTFHEPVHPSEFADRKALADHCHAIVQKGHAEAGR
ncbi:MAG: 1-acyl-sn-glycerol-3-phosphate acyltransferase, partial [Pseudomonadota bacterium]